MSKGRHVRWSLFAIAVSAVVLCWLEFRPDGAAPASAETADRAATPPAVAPRAHHANAPASLEVPGPTAAPAPVKLPPPMQKVLDENPQLAAYYRLEQKVLPSAEDREALHAMLSDPGMIDQVVADLLTPEVMYTRDIEARRMVAVEFLGDAAAWSDNPAMGKVMEAVERVIFADNITEHAPDALAQSLAGDKAELYTQLLHRSPERAVVIADHAQGTHVEALLAYSKRQYDSSMAAMKADEAKPH